MNDTLIEKIQTLKNENGAIIMAHNYQISEVQEIADFTGDSLELSRKAASVPNELIVFCGVYFMAETASILSPEKTILIPDERAGCPMVDMSPLDAVLEWQAKYPDAITVTYVNSSAEVKAVSDYCCTSANAIQVVDALPPDAQVLFVPDKHLGSYVAEHSRREIILFPGFCPTHNDMLPADIIERKAEYPDALFMVHPECPRLIRNLADEILSTSGMCKVAKAYKGKNIIVGTEIGMLHRLKKENPEKQFMAVSPSTICPNMKRITLEKILWSLEEMKHEVKVPDDIREKALLPVQRMVEILG